MIRQCTRCDLRFRSEGELGEHLRADHGADESVVERYRYIGGREQDPLYPDLTQAGPARRRLLVVANQTLRSPALLQVLAERAADGPVEVVVVVPATHSGDYGPGGDAAVTPDTDERGVAQARWRLRQVIDELRQRGVEAAGLLGPPDPYEAAGRLLEESSFDEVVVSTLPAGLSRWFGLDVPARLRRRFDVPVTEVQAGAPAAAGYPQP